MQQRYHSNATTNVRLRSEIHKSIKSNTALTMLKQVPTQKNL